MDPNLIVAGWILCALVAGLIAERRHQGFVPGFLLGAILGPLGVLLAAIQKPTESR